MAGGPTTSVYIYITSLKTDIFGSEKWWLEDENSFWNGPNIRWHGNLWGSNISWWLSHQLHLKTYSSKWFVESSWNQGVKIQQTYLYTYIYIYEPGSKLLVLGMVIPPLIGNPYNGYINPYYWVDDHPLLYGNNGSLDPSTYVVYLHKICYP